MLSIQDTPQVINDSLRIPYTEECMRKWRLYSRVRLERETEHYLKLIGRRKQPVLHRLPVKNRQDTTKLAESLNSSARVRYTRFQFKRTNGGTGETVARGKDLATSYFLFKNFSPVSIANVLEIFKAFLC